MLLISKHFKPVDQALEAEITNKMLAEENSVTRSERTPVLGVNAKQPFGLMREQRGAVAGGRHA